ncbi:MAG: prolyl oligopeptidase family serine peptidase [Cyclobacteriaceae bacterium]
MNLYILAAMFFFGILSVLAQAPKFYCPPCPFDCHDKVYDQPGVCPVCNMDLVQRKVSSYNEYEMQNVKIKNGDVELNGVYYTPMNHNERLASVVIVHGSAPSTYEDVGYYTAVATKLGLAVLAFDKRGVGESAGTYERFTVERSEAWFDLLASDVLAWGRWLRTQPEVDSSKMGLFGGSQAGWIMPLAASQTDIFKFIISGEGVSVSAGEENYFSELTGDGDENGMPIGKADSRMKYFKGPHGFDPRSILKELSIDMLWFFGTSDPVIPVDASLRTLKEINNDRFKIVILPHGDHNFKNVETGERYDLATYVRPWLATSGILK